MSCEEAMSHEERCAIYQSVFESCANELKLNHAKIVAAEGELKAIAKGALAYDEVKRPDKLLDIILLWRANREWFMWNKDVAISLAMVCDVAGTDLKTVRGAYSEWLRLPFDIAPAVARLEFLTYVRKDG